MRFREKSSRYLDYIVKRFAFDHREGRWWRPPPSLSLPLPPLPLLLPLPPPLTSPSPLSSLPLLLPPSPYGEEGNAQGLGALSSVTMKWTISTTRRRWLFLFLFEGRRYLVPVPFHMSVDEEGDQNQEDDGDGDIEGAHQFPHLAPVFAEDEPGPSQGS